MVSLLLSSVFTFNVLAQENPSVVLNGTKLAFDVPPQIINGRTLVPFRAIFETLGYEVFWDEENRIAMGAHTGKDLIVGFKIGYPATFSAKVSDSKKLNEIPIDVPAQVVNNRTMIPLRALSDSIGANVQWDGNTSTVYITYNDGSKLESIDDIESYLNSQYSMIKIGDEIYPVRYAVTKNYFDFSQWDIEINPTIGLANEFLNPFEYDYNEATVSREEKQMIIDAVTSFIEPMAKDIIKHFPNHKFHGSFNESYYKYPNLKLDMQHVEYFNWTNYDYEPLKHNSDTVPGEFRWVYELDYSGRMDFHNYFEDIEINTPVAIENDFDTFVVKSLKFKDSDKISNEGDAIPLTYEATANGNGFAHLNFYDKNDKLLGSSYTYFYSGTQEYMDVWPIETAKIVISDGRDENYETDESVTITSNIPFKIPAEYSFYDDFEIDECQFIKKDKSVFWNDCYDYMFKINATSNKYIYIIFFDEDNIFLDYTYEYIWNGENTYTFRDIPDGVAHIQFSEEKTTKIKK